MKDHLVINIVGWFRQDQELTNSANDAIGQAAEAAILKMLIYASKFCENLQKCEKAYFDQPLECEAPKTWSKYTNTMNEIGIP